MGNMETSVSDWIYRFVLGRATAEENRYFFQIKEAAREYAFGGNWLVKHYEEGLGGF